MSHFGRKAARKTAQRSNQISTATATPPSHMTLPSIDNGINAVGRVTVDAACHSRPFLGDNGGMEDRTHFVRALESGIGTPDLELRGVSRGQGQEAQTHPYAKDLPPPHLPQSLLDLAGTSPSLVSTRTAPTDQIPDSPSYDNASLVDTLVTELSLPFLRRNVRKGFKLRFREANDQPTKTPSARFLIFDPRKVENATYDNKPWKFTQIVYDLTCPFCILFKAFTTVTHLVQHIHWDHECYATRYQTLPGEVLDK